MNDQRLYLYNHLRSGASALVWFFALTLLSFLPFQAHGAEKADQSNRDIMILAGDDYEELLSIEDYSQWLQLNTSLIHNTNKTNEIVTIEPCAINQKTCPLFLPYREYENWHIVESIVVDENRIEEYVEQLADHIYQEPRNARFELLSDNRVSAFDLGSNGQKLDKEKARDALKDALPQIFSQQGNGEPTPIRLSVQGIPADVQSSDAEKLGITSLIGEGRSNFAGSSQDRIYNIRHALRNFQGRLLKPEEELSFVDILGPVDEESGYRPELVIRNNRTEPEYGGGICQVSTTLFRAAIYSGMEITARRNHSYPVKYYKPIGFDATVYVPRPDLKFVNNTPGYVLIQADIEGSELVFRFYGADDGRTVELDGPYVTEKNEDGSMKTIFTQTVLDEAGNILIEESFRSNYDSPDNYPKPEDIDLSKKPKDWSKRQWEEYKKQIEALRS